MDTDSIFRRDPKPKPTLEERVVRAAEAALEDHRSVSAIDVLEQIQLVANVALWRKGRIPTLEQAMQGSYEKVAKALAIFERWANSHGLQPLPVRYVIAAREGERELQILGPRYAGLEDKFRNQYVSPRLSEKEKQKFQERTSKAPERVVFLNNRDSACSECGVELPKGSFLFMDKDLPLCLACAGMGDLEYLGRGDTALTRRATKYSPSRAVVVEFSRSRGRYERQGILATEAALRQAEEECAADAPERARKRASSAEARKKEDAATVEKMTAKIRAMFPGCPPSEAERIAAHTAVRGSGRVGRTEAGRKLDSDALTLAVQAAVRHRHTNYDELLAQGYDRSDARAAVSHQIDQILDSWRWGV